MLSDDDINISTPSKPGKKVKQSPIASQNNTKYPDNRSQIQKIIPHNNPDKKKFYNNDLLSDDDKKAAN